jgi:hypothetical protein
VQRLSENLGRVRGLVGIRFVNSRTVQFHSEFEELLALIEFGGLFKIIGEI